MGSASSTSPQRISARILLVDDNRMGLMARKSVLEELGCRIKTIGAAAEALEWLGRESCDLVITDYRMPGVKGAEFIGRIRELKPSLGVILISGFTDSLGLNEKNTGADVVIQKSSHEVAHMIRAVRSLLRDRRRKKPPTSEEPPGGRRKRA